MDIKKIIDNAIADCGISQAHAARLMGWVPQQLNNRLSRNTFKVEDFFDLMDVLGVEVRFISRNTGRDISTLAKKKGHGPSVTGTSGNVTFSTDESSAVSGRFVDGVLEDELYVDPVGRYFIVSGREVKGVSSNVAHSFIEENGTY